jgi:CRP-like cAMP-binding protein
VPKLPQETVLFETGDTIKTVYFPLSGVVSVVVDLTTSQWWPDQVPLIRLS